jgi:type I restriction enzyme M protein
MSSRQSGEGEIRAAMVEADLISCMIALPPQLFRTTQIPACLWFLAKDKSAQGSKRLTDRTGQVLFIDARSLGTMVNRTERIFTDEEVGRIASTYHAWRGTPSAHATAQTYEDVPGFCCSASLDEIRIHDHVLVPGRFISAAKLEHDDAEPIAEKIARLKDELFKLFAESADLDESVRRELGRI